MLGNEDYDEPSWYVKYSYEEHESHITQIKGLDKEDVIYQLDVYCRFNAPYTYEFVTEEDYVNYFNEQVSSWTVSKKKSKNK